MTPTVWYTYLAFQLVRVIDAGGHLDIDETHRAINDGTILEWLHGQQPNIAISTYNNDPAAHTDVVDRFQGIERAGASRRFGVTHDGLPLLVAYCIEAVQQLATPRP